MTKARKEQVCLEATPYYHCVSRCVRRAFLCGEQYEHRRQWVEDKLLDLAQIFCVDIAAYAVMSNHYHVVLYIDKERALNLSDEQVVGRWHQLYKGNLLSQRFELGEELDSAELRQLEKTLTEWRSRLMDISWFMRIMNEFIAREANKEDQCTGRFWEGRFKSQALLDEKALLACMAYVDLNPIRAKMAKTPEDSAHTSVKKRCEKAKQSKSPNHKCQQPKELLAFVGNPRQKMPKGIPSYLNDYLSLIDWSGRILRDDKRGAIPRKTPAILDRLGIAPESWKMLINEFEIQCKGFAGSQITLDLAYSLLGYQRIPHHSQLISLFGE